jgi:hypothetical protein
MELGNSILGWSTLTLHQRGLIQQIRYAVILPGSEILATLDAHVFTLVMLSCSYAVAIICCLCTRAFLAIRGFCTSLAFLLKMVLKS